MPIEGKGMKAMFELTPFERRQKDMMSAFEHFGKGVWNDFTNSLSNVRTDVIDKGDHYLVQAELPGFTKEEIQIEVKDNLLTISAGRVEETEEKKANYICRERRYGSFSRGFDLANIDAVGIKARYENGVLELTLPKKEPPQPEGTNIHID